MKKLFLILSFLLFACFLVQPVKASASSVEDNAGLFTADEITQLDEAIDNLNQHSDAQMFIVTNSTSVGTIRNYADNYLRDKVGNNNNGTVLVIDMASREVYISTSGNMITAITDSRLNKILDNVQGSLQDGDYYAAANDYVKGVRRYFVKEVTLIESIIAGVIAVVAGLAVFFTNLSRYQLKFGGYKYPFREKSSLNLDTQTDQLVNSYITTRRIPRNNNNGGGGFGGGSSTHSSGGGTFGGGGRSF
ncbi:TPM domain-containing protein [Enterococcus sp. HY326]|uniref:TPM domain-containing protein n=1 Tax=Enterococcus sp. HY326 TaxID=2971265 RepID=UPI00223E98FD|nr:TPM domain-containing protein [Enterococcus sp. HY326]